MDATNLESITGNQRLAKQLAFILEVEKLKTVLRRTPLLDRSRVETDAEHTWQITMMACVFAEYARDPINLERVLKMLLIHDVVEIDAGDTFAYDTVGRASQAQRELKAADRIFALLPADQATELRELWDEFEAKDSAESKFANAMDRMQPLLQNYFTGGGTWHSSGINSDDVNRRMAPIAIASQSLGELTETLIELAIDQGMLVKA